MRWLLWVDGHCKGIYPLTWVGGFFITSLGLHMQNSRSERENGPRAHDRSK
jgi:hypothetical protein